MKQFWNWLVTSSADPSKTSLAIKGLLTIGSAYVLNIAYITCRLAIYCLPITQTWLTQTIDVIATIIQFGLLLVGAIIALIGLPRKAWIGQWSAQ